AAGIADRPWMAPSERGPLVIEARLYLLGYLVVAAGSALVGTRVVLLVCRAVSARVGTVVLLLVAIAPWLVAQAFLRPYLLAEHTGCGSTRDCLENTRTTLSMAVGRLFAWDMPSPAEHHAHPA